MLVWWVGARLMRKVDRKENHDWMLFWEYANVLRRQEYRPSS